MTGPRTLVLNGSPRTDGNSAALAAAFVNALGGPTSRVDLYRSNITPCLDCGVCRGGGSCPIADAVPEVLELTAAADVVVVASPLHFSSLSAPVIALFSRFQPYWHGAALPARRRRGALLVSAGSRYPDMFLAARKVAAAAFKTLRIPFHDMVAVPDTDALSAGENRQAMAEVRELAENILREV